MPLLAQRGAVHIYDVATGVLQQTLYGPVPATANFGASVTILGNKLAVGGYFGEGRVFLFDLATGNLLLTLTSPLPIQFGFGSSVAMTANHIIVGQGPSSNGSVGSAHVYDATTGSYLYSLNNPSPDAADFFGQTVRTAGNRILIGAPGDDTVAEHAGAAYLFDATTGGLLHTFLPTGSTTSQFGFSLDINDSRIAVGSTSGSRVHLYDASTFALIQELPGVHLGDERFGSPSTFGGDRLFVHN